MRLKSILLLVGLSPFFLLAQERSFIDKIVPHYAKLQYAGGIGFLSVGIGYESKHKKFEGDFMYGYVPKSVGGVTIHSVSSKLTWLPVRHSYRDIQVNFITAGILINYTFGPQYFSFSPENYPFSYYDFPTSLHAGLFLGGSIKKGRLSVYYEAGTIDAEFISFLANTKSLNVTDVINIGAGIKVSLR